MPSVPASVMPRPLASGLSRGPGDLAVAAVCGRAVLRASPEVDRGVGSLLYGFHNVLLLSVNICAACHKDVGFRVDPSRYAVAISSCLGV